MYKKESGYYEVASIRGVSIYVHWSFPISGLLIAVYFNSDWENFITYIIGCVLLIFIHELGHFMAARYARLSVHALTISGGGGMCYAEQPKNYREAFLLYSGGILAQLVLFVMSALFFFLYGNPSTEIGRAIALILTVINLFFIFINIIPSKFADGKYSDGYVLLLLVKMYFMRA